VRTAPVVNERKRFIAQFDRKIIASSSCDVPIFDVGL